MKLQKQDENSFTFLIGKRERDLLVALLLRYPVLSSAHFRKRHPAQSAEARSDDELLRDALADQQKESRRNLEEWLKEPNRFEETELGLSFTITAGEMEWLLQVLNDIRVGSWVQLGEPDGKTLPSAQLTEEQMQLAWSLELAGLFQHVLLQAIEPAD